MVHAYNCYRLYNYYLQYSLTICWLHGSCSDKSTRRKYKHHSNHMWKILKYQRVCLTSNVWYWLVKTIWLLATIVLQWNMSRFGDFKMPLCSFISMMKQISSHAYQTKSDNNLLEDIDSPTFIAILYVFLCLRAWSITANKVQYKWFMS